MIIDNVDGIKMHVMQAIINYNNLKLHLFTIYSDVNNIVSTALYHYIKIFTIIFDESKYHIEINRIDTSVPNFSIYYNIHYDDFKNIHEIIENCNVEVLDTIVYPDIVILNGQKVTSLDSFNYYLHHDDNITLILIKPLPEELLCKLKSEYNVIKQTNSIITLNTENESNLRADIYKNLIREFSDYIDVQRLIIQWPYSFEPSFIDSNHFVIDSNRFVKFDNKIDISKQIYQTVASKKAFDTIVKILDSNNYKLLTKQTFNYQRLEMFTIFYFYNLHTKDFCAICLHSDILELFLSNKNLYNLIVLNPT